MDDRAREDIMRAADRVARDLTPQPGACNATPPGYNVKVYCAQPTGHHGRHSCNAISWPGR